MNVAQAVTIETMAENSDQSQHSLIFRFTFRGAGPPMFIIILVSRGTGYPGMATPSCAATTVRRQLLMTTTRGGSVTDTLCVSILIALLECNQQLPWQHQSDSLLVCQCFHNTRPILQTLGHHAGC